MPHSCSLGLIRISPQWCQCTAIWAA